MGNKADLPRVQYPVLRFGKGRTGDLHLLRPRLDAGAAFAIEADRAPRIEALSPTLPSAAEVERIESNGKKGPLLTQSGLFDVSKPHAQIEDPSWCWFRPMNK